MSTWVRSSYCQTSACAEVQSSGDGVLIRSSERPDLPPLPFTAEEWAAFIAGVKNGEFDNPGEGA